MSSKVKVNGERRSFESLTETEFSGSVIGYSLDADGYINKCQLYSMPASPTSYDFNAKLLTFGGYAGRSTFYADSAAVICVPEIADNEDDYYEKVTLTNDGTYNAVPFEIDSKTQKAKAVAIVAKMDADSLQPIKSDDDVSIVFKTVHQIDDEDDEVLSIQMLTGDEIETILVDSDSKLYELACSLRKGDLIKYSLNAFDRISNLRLLASIQGLEDYYRAYENSPNETVYGIVSTIDLNRISATRNELVDEISVAFKADGSGRTVDYEIPIEDGPAVYKYNKRNGNVSVATTDDISSIEDVGSGATKVFMFVNNNDVETLVIIE